MILVLIQGIEPWSSTYEVDVLAIELDERIWWTDQGTILEPYRYERHALPIELSVHHLVPHSGVEPEAPRLWDAGDETASCGIY